MDNADLLKAVEVARKVLDKAEVPQDGRFVRVCLEGRFFEYSENGIVEYSDGTFTKLV